MKSAIDRQVQELVDRKSGERHEFTRQELDKINDQFDDLLMSAVAEVFNES